MAAWRGSQSGRSSGERSLPPLQERWTSAAAELAELRGRSEEHGRWLAEHGALRGDDLARGFAIRDELQVRERDRGRDGAAAMVRLEANPPPYLIAALGERPDGAGAQRAWRDAAAALDAHRARYNVTDSQRPLGSVPVAGTDDGIARLIDRTRAVMGAAPQPGAPRSTTTGDSQREELDDLISTVRQHDADRRHQKQTAPDRDRYRHYDHHSHPVRERSRGPSIGM